MKIESITKTESIKTEQQIVRYSDTEISSLILADLQCKGYNFKTLRFETDFKYVSDEWGMNSHPTTIFKGAVIELQNK